MAKIYTIGFTKKDARTFFELLKQNGVKRVLDIRLTTHRSWQDLKVVG